MFEKTISAIIAITIIFILVTTRTRIRTRIKTIIAIARSARLVPI